MKISQSGIDHIKQWERLELKAYQPLAGDKWTIGYGHTRTAYEGMEIDPQKAETLLWSDIAWVERCINQNVKVTLTQDQFDALCSFVFNIGCPAFRASTLLKELNAGRYERVPDQLKRWVFDTGSSDEPIGGLVNRRASESLLWVTSDDVVTGNIRPSIPMGRSPKEIITTSKTVKGAAATAAGSGTISIGAVVGEMNAITAEYTQTLDSLKTAAGESVALLLVSGIVLVAAGFIIYNRIRDSRIGRSY